MNPLYSIHEYVHISLQPSYHPPHFLLSHHLPFSHFSPHHSMRITQTHTHTHTCQYYSQEHFYRHLSGRERERDAPFMLSLVTGMLPCNFPTIHAKPHRTHTPLLPTFSPPMPPMPPRIITTHMYSRSFHPPYSPQP